MRLYLDTNILVYLRTERARDEIRAEVLSELLDYGNTLYTSAVCVHEMIHLFHIGKLKPERTGEGACGVMGWLSMRGIGIVPVSERHLSSYSCLPLIGDHRDPNDRLIIAQAMSDKATLVSSDRQFPRYVRHGLRLLFNGR